MLVLVRDAALANYPSISIAALGSSMVQQTLRDRWTSWESNSLRTASSPGRASSLLAGYLDPSSG